MSIKNRPSFSHKELLDIAEFEFGIKSQTIEKIEELPSYDDANYVLIVKQKYRETQPSIVIKCTTINTLGRVAFQIEFCFVCVVWLCFFLLRNCAIIRHPKKTKNKKNTE